MALDSKQKRLSQAGVLGSLGPNLPDPDGTIGKVDRMHFVQLYSESVGTIPFTLGAFLTQVGTDIPTFFDQIDFAETFTHSGTDYDCIFTDASTSPVPGGGNERDGPWAVLRSVDVDGIMTHGDTVTVHGGTYTIEGMRPDGTGVTTIILIPT